MQAHGTVRCDNICFGANLVHTSGNSLVLENRTCYGAELGFLRLDPSEYGPFFAQRDLSHSRMIRKPDFNHRMIVGNFKKHRRLIQKVTVTRCLFMYRIPAIWEWLRQDKRAITGRFKYLNVLGDRIPLVHNDPFAGAFITDFEFVAHSRNGFAGGIIYLDNLDFTLIHKIFQDIRVNLLVSINHYFKRFNRCNGRIARICLGNDNGGIWQRFADTVSICVGYLCIQHFAGGF